MFKTATYFIKAQIPKATMPVLIDLYVQELEYQQGSEITVDNNTILFRQHQFKIYKPY